MTLPLALLLLVMMVVVGLVCVLSGRSPVPWSRLRQVERHRVRAYGGFLVLLAAAVTAAKAFDAVGVTYRPLLVERRLLPHRGLLAGHRSDRCDQPDARGLHAQLRVQPLRGA